MAHALLIFIMGIGLFFLFQRDRSPTYRSQGKSMGGGVTPLELESNIPPSRNNISFSRVSGQHKFESLFNGVSLATWHPIMDLSVATPCTYKGKTHHIDNFICFAYSLFLVSHSNQSFIIWLFHLAIWMFYQNQLLILKVEEVYQTNHQVSRIWFKPEASKGFKLCQYLHISWRHIA